MRKAHPARHQQGFTIFFTGLSGSGTWGAVGSTSMRCDAPEETGVKVCAIAQPSASGDIAFRILLENRDAGAHIVDLTGVSLDVDGDGHLPVGPPDPVEILGGTSTLATLSFAVQAASLRDAAFVTLRVPAHAGLEAAVEFSAEDLVVVGS